MDVEQLLNSKSIRFEPSGADLKISCLNPDHTDTHPSMRIDKLTGIFHCFACGYKGNIFTYYGTKANFLQIKRELFKRKIANKLAQNIGLTMPDDRITFDKNWRNISGSTYKAFEAFEHHHKDFIGRVVFPIRGINGKIQGYNARALSPTVEPKYLISPDKAKFPLWPAKINNIQGRVILVEGLFDAINLHDKGLTNAVCSFGTNKVTKEKLQILKIQGVSGIDIFFDGDEAGQKGATEVASLIESCEMDSRNIYLKDTDPGELTAQKVLKLKETLYGKDSPSGDQT